MKYILNSSVMCKLTQDNELIITGTDVGVITVSEGIDELLEILKIYRVETDKDTAYEMLNKKYYVSKLDYEETIKILTQNNILKLNNQTTGKIELSEFHMEKYSRQISSLNSIKGIDYQQAIEMQRKINQSTVCIIGLGGTGSHLALTLASIGVERMILVDFDKVELSNTSRQVLYDESDIGQLKIEVAAEKLKRYNSKLMVTTHNVRIQDISDLKFLEEYKCIDLLILCADTPRGEIAYIIDEATQKYDIPWFAYGPFQHSQIMIGPYIIPKKTKSYKEIFSKEIVGDDARTELINSSFVASVCDPYNGFASQMASIESFKILTNYRESLLVNRRYYVDTDKWEMEYIDYDGE